MNKHSIKAPGATEIPEHAAFPRKSRNVQKAAGFSVAVVMTGLRTEANFPTP